MNETPPSRRGEAPSAAPLPASGRPARRSALRWLVLVFACAILAAVFLIPGGQRDDVRVQFHPRTIHHEGVLFIRLNATNAGARPALLSSLSADVRLNGLWFSLCRDHPIGHTLLPGQHTNITVPALYQGEAFRGTVITGYGCGRFEMFLHRVQAKARTLFRRPAGHQAPFARWQTNAVPEFSVNAQ